MMLSNGQSIPVTGWWQARCGQRLYLRGGDFAPMCPRHVMGTTWWRLVAPVGGPRPFR
jgi:hypothetical protein